MAIASILMLPALWSGGIWRALNPDKLYDTLEIEDIDHLNEYKTVIVKMKASLSGMVSGSFMTLPRE
jgi:hypothetical protein